MENNLIAFKNGELEKDALAYIALVEKDAADAIKTR